MVTPTFRKIYGKLNKEQRRAVDAIEGPVMVIAGPGTGKTQILTLRIANILRKTDTSPDSILALTFTESGVFSMRKRLVEIIGSAGYRVHIHTFHGFCNEIIRRFPASFPRIIGANHINDIDKISILKKLIETLNIKKLRPFGDNFFYLNAIRQKISELKREDISAEELSKSVKKQRDEFKNIPDISYSGGVRKGRMKGKYKELENKIKKNAELALIYKAYERTLIHRHLYDYEDMIIETVKALKKDKNLLLSLQEEYQYILADEHQDANNSQNHLLELLASYHQNPNLFIVGDEKQAIFRFQGASLENFLYFKNLYKSALIISLVRNYRSLQHILDSAYSMMKKNISLPEDSPRVENLVGKKDSTENKIELHVFSQQEYEYLFLANDIEDRLKDGVLPEEIAVLYRNNRDVEAIMSILEKMAVPFIVESDQNVLADIDIRKFIALLRAVNNFGDDSLLISILHIDFLDIDGLDIYKLSLYAKKERRKLFDIIKSEKVLAKAGVKKTKSLHRLYESLSIWKQIAHNKPLLEFLEIIADKSGFLNYILSNPQTTDKISKLSGLFDSAKQFVENHRDYKLSDFIHYIDLLEEHNILVKKDSKAIVPNRVRLMTAHKSKGLEFDFVYIVGARDGHWGNKRKIEHFKIPIQALNASNEENNNDERRLFYVALTRARYGAFISYPKEGSNGEPQLPSQFVEEIDKKFIKEVDTTDFERKVKKEFLLTPKKEKKSSVKDKHFLNELFLDEGLSVTALNNYLECPWNYFYSNLLRIPKAPNKHLMFGTAIHQTLKSFFDKMQKETNISTKKLLMLFTDFLNRLPLSEIEYGEVLKKGKEALSGYYDRYKNSWKNTSLVMVLNEFKIGVQFPIELSDASYLKLRGDLDKVEILNTKNEVNVVDYKTGKPKSRNAIEGKTKSSSGDYKRQLIFYKLLLDLYDDKKFNMGSGEIDFIEPDEKGRYHKEKFLIIGEEVAELKGVIKNTAKEILNLSFWNQKCDDKKCEYCRLRSMMK
jgi:DNA helicase II / ATP-dependent DNA helicase PcrA